MERILHNGVSCSHFSDELLCNWCFMPWMCIRHLFDSGAPDQTDCDTRAIGNILTLIWP